MNLTKILSIVLFAVSLVLAWVLYDSIHSTIEFRESIANTEKQITDKLAVIREAEKAFLEQHGHYTADWDSLRNFIENGKVPITLRTETITQLSYGEEKVEVKIRLIRPKTALLERFRPKSKIGRLLESICKAVGHRQ